MAFVGNGKLVVGSELLCSHEGLIDRWGGLYGSRSSVVLCCDKRLSGGGKDLAAIGANRSGARCDRFLRGNERTGDFASGSSILAMLGGQSRRSDSVGVDK